MAVIVIFRPRPARVLGLLVCVLTFGLVRLDVPRVGRVRRMRAFRRWLTMRGARACGRRDGKLGYPRTDESIAPAVVSKLARQGDAVVNGIAARWAATDSRLRGEHAAIQRGIEAVSDRIERERQALARLREEHDETYDRLSSLEKRNDRRDVEERWRLSPWFYWPVIVLVFAGELPLNVLAFRVFGEGNRLTYAMTGGLAAVLVLCAHSLGVLARRRPMIRRDLAVTCLVAAAPVIAIVAIAFVRERYVEVQAQAGEALSFFGTGSGIAVFVVMNLAIFVGAFALSYLHHSPHADLLRSAGRAVRRARRRCNRKDRALARLGAATRWLEAKLALWEAGWSTAHASALFQAKRHAALFEAASAEYWDANRAAAERGWNLKRSEARSRGEDLPTQLAWPPPCYEQSAKVTLPPELLLQPTVPPPASTNGHARSSRTRRTGTAA